ncbi:MAG TPA: primosomal protein N' [Armatimonadota bacterium]|nr:primosomal protein N' [Armatimonadota bacterium]
MGPDPVSRAARPCFATVLISRRSATQDLTLTYAVPERLRGRLRPGVPVLVPLRRGRAVAHVLEVDSEAPPEGTRARDLIDVVEDAPDIPAELLDLAQWVAAETRSSLAVAARMLVPEGAAPTVVREYAHVPRPSAALSLFDEPAGEGPVETALRQAGRPMAVDELAARVGRPIDAPELEALERAGVVRSVWGLRSARVRPRRVPAVELAIAPEEAVQLADEVAGRAQRQAEVLFELCRSGGPVPLSRLDKQRSAVAVLVERGWLRRVEVDIRRRPTPSGSVARGAANATLSPGQQEALGAILEGISSGTHGTVLLHGITGSGKTEVYLRAIEQVVAGGRTAITLVPEISLTPQTQALFSRRFPDATAVLHSGLSSGERLDEWYRIRRGEVSVVLGARSAIFAPIENLGLLVIDEEHETSYKQDRAPRYHAREVARRRAERAGAVLVLGSATPSLETTYEANQGRCRRVVLPERVGGGTLPTVDIVDMRQEKADQRRTMLGSRLVEEIGARLERGEQTILFLNRRGYSPFIMCRQCGHAWRCPECDVSLTFHMEEKVLRCHHCDWSAAAPTECDQCGSIHVAFFGTGTERVEQEVSELFPQARLLRMDRDTVTSKGAHARILAQFARGDADILMGTQMIAKGLDFPEVTLVGVVLADTGLGFPDFRAAEHTFQLLSQVSGRSGRGAKAGRVLIQTFRPDHYAVVCAAQHDYDGFAERELRSREPFGYPPFRRLANLVTSDDAEARAEADATACAEAFENVARSAESVTVLGPAPAPLRRLRGRFRWHVEVLAPRDALGAVVDEALGRLDAAVRDRVVVDIDPVSTL